MPKPHDEPAENKAFFHGTPPVSEWSSLTSVGDIRRFLRWVIVAVADDHIDSRKGAILRQLANSLLGAMREEREASVEAYLSQLESLLSLHEMQSNGIHEE